jgi:LAS superfamily LD-carboxypeptidase LdcB
MNTMDKPTAKNKWRKLRFSFGVIKLCITIFAFSMLFIQAANAQSIKVLIKGIESLLIQNELDAYQAQGKDIIVKQPNNTDLSSINDKNGLEFDERAIDQLNAMLSDATSQDLSPIVCSAYRTIEKQKTLFNNQVYKYMAKGLSQEQAETEARKYVAYPGTSEHNLGLAADIVSVDYQILDEKQADTEEIKWLIEHCSEYGFIIRYPKDKVHITGVAYEPWHFRYVGVQAAQEIMKSDLCLEEYLVNIGKK